MFLIFHTFHLNINKLKNKFIKKIMVKDYCFILHYRKNAFVLPQMFSNFISSLVIEKNILIFYLIREIFKNFLTLFFERTVLSHVTVQIDFFSVS